MEKILVIGNVESGVMYLDSEILTLIEISRIIIDFKLKNLWQL